MRNILVTGADGQLGKCIQKIAKNTKEYQFVYYNSKSLDITNAEQIAEVFAANNFEYCINCAAYTNVEQAEKTPEIAYEVNAEGVKLLANACLLKNVTLIHVSTDYVFDGEKVTPYCITDDTNPINVYGKSKLLGEQYIQQILKQYCIIRTSWLYSEFGKNFYKTILSKANNGEDLQIADDQTGCPTNANNLAAYILRLINLTTKKYGVHHFTDGKAMTWYGFAERILEENNLRTTVFLQRAKNYRTLARRPKNSVLE